VGEGRRIKAGASLVVNHLAVDSTDDPTSLRRRGNPSALQLFGPVDTMGFGITGRLHPRCWHLMKGRSPGSAGEAVVVGVMGDMKGEECPAPRIALGTSGGRESTWSTGEPPPPTSHFSGRLISGPRQRPRQPLRAAPILKPRACRGIFTCPASGWIAQNDQLHGVQCAG
jgi:hypothetical protein